MKVRVMDQEIVEMSNQMCARTCPSDRNGWSRLRSQLESFRDRSKGFSVEHCTEEMVNTDGIPLYWRMAE
jgi:hypothetical protein